MYKRTNNGYPSIPLIAFVNTRGHPKHLTGQRSFRFCYGMALDSHVYLQPGTLEHWNIHLYHVVSVDVVTKTRAENQRDVLVDLAIDDGHCSMPLRMHWSGAGRSRSAPYPLLTCYVPFESWFFAGPWQFKELLSANQKMSSIFLFHGPRLAMIEVLGTIPTDAYTIYLNATLTLDVIYSMLLHRNGARWMSNSAFHNLFPL
ncbi:hypothetical protein EDC04DRAFT_746202 [Pisolithus marmoratus]|nr:hypothetical protein EDC04DRAFT_746202 [Pisolithus marmoratus]